ncbi:hypothetical protein [Streptomyces sp. AD55]|uniref:hypothetical protein n=1 Tax=Streptomyces sp. AD55 TaxID=3242895 RepID=UPI0035281E4D
MNRPHPKDDEIRALLAEGHTNSEIRRRTGADMRTIARRRSLLRLGPAPAPRPSPRPHPKEKEIRALLARGASNSAIVRELRVDKVAVARLRREHGFRAHDQQPLTLEQKFMSKVHVVDGVHLAWDGSTARGGTPVLVYRGQIYTAARIAFGWANGRPPQGRTYSECDVDRCVAPACVDDEPGRQRIREQLRTVLGRGERPKTCHAGHDQAVHGRLQANAVSMCLACKREAKHAAVEGAAL